MKLLRMAACLMLLSPWPAFAANFLEYGYGPANRGYTSEKLDVPVTLVWRFVTGPGKDGGVTPIVVDKDIFYAAGPPGGYAGEGKEYGLYCLDLETGAYKWRVSTEQPARSVPVYSNGLVWFGDDAGTLRAVDPIERKAVWELDVGQAIRTPIVASGNMIYFGTSARSFYAVDTKKREKAWVFHPDDDVYAAPATDGRTVYVAALDNALYALDARTGLEKWRYQLTGTSSLFGAPVIGTRYIYLVARNRLYALGRYGKQVWSVDFKNDVAGDIAVAHGMLYVAMLGVGTGAVYGLEEFTGRVKWRYPENPETVSEFSPTSSPAVSGNVVFVGGSYGATLALSADKGEVLWRYLARRPEAPSSPGMKYAATGHAVVANGSLYTTYDDGTLCRFTRNAPEIDGPEVTRMTPQPDSIKNGWPPLLIGANIYDEGSGVVASSIEMSFDGKPVEYRLRLQNSDCFYEIKAGDPAEPIPDGWHTITVSASNYLGLKTEKSWRFLSDRNYSEAPPPAEAAPPPEIISSYEEEEE